MSCAASACDAGDGDAETSIINSQYLALILEPSIMILHPQKLAA
jgi:hypothetical protein